MSRSTEIDFKKYPMQLILAFFVCFKGSHNYHQEQERGVKDKHLSH